MAKTVGKITIDNGSIQVEGKEVGRVDQELKFGYHPAVKLSVGKKIEWFELDTEKLIDKVFAKAAEFIG